MWRECQKTDQREVVKMDDILNAGNIPYVSEASVSVEIETEDMTLNIGPQHPSTHGVLRLVAKVDGEKISSVEPVLGYMHRGYEKLAEVRTYPQITTLVNRIDWVSGFANEIPFIAATEKLMEIEAPERAKHIRFCLLYTSPSPRDRQKSRMPSSA